MTINLTPVCRFCLGCLLAIFSAGCSPKQPVTYYNLTSLSTAQQRPAASPTRPPLAVGLGPVSFPEALSRAQIAARLDAQRLQYSDFHRWSGTLADDFAEVLLQDLTAQLPEQATAALFPWAGYFQPTHRLVLQVSRFDGTFGDEVVLAARWTITNPSGKETLLTRQSTIHVKVAGREYQDLVSAQSQAVADLATEIAAALAGQ